MLLSVAVTMLRKLNVVLAYSRTGMARGGAEAEEFQGFAYAVVCDCEGEELARDAGCRVASRWRNDDAAYGSLAY